MRIFQKQLWHLLALLALLLGVFKGLNQWPELLTGKFANISTPYWLLISIAIPIAHQTYVWICWRLELYYQTLSKTLGKKSFSMYKSGFLVLFFSRILSIIFLSTANKNTLLINDTLQHVLVIIIVVIFIYSVHSVLKYFGMNRAVGLDHFSEDAAQLPFVRKGIFKYSSNAMYTFVFLIIYLPGLLYESSAGLLVGLFSHCYIWVHYYCTELPDINYIYPKK